MSLFLSLSAGTSSGGLNRPFALSSVTIADSLACLFPVNRPNTLVDDVVKEGILGPGVHKEPPAVSCPGRVPLDWNSTCAEERRPGGDFVTMDVAVHLVIG